MPAFAAAHAEGALAVELDVQLSRDGEVVVVHDPDLSRITGGDDPRRVGDLEWRELEAVRLRSDARLVRLWDVLAWARGANVAVNVELKRDGGRKWELARRAARLVAHAEVDVLLSSFDPLLLAVAKAVAPHVPSAWLTDAKESPPFDAMAFAARTPLVVAMHPHYGQVTATRADRLHQKGLALGAYTVNEPQEITRLVALGVDWLITDTPGATRDVIASLAG